MYKLKNNINLFNADPKYKFFYRLFIDYLYRKYNGFSVFYFPFGRKRDNNLEVPLFAEWKIGLEKESHI